MKAAWGIALLALLAVSAVIDAKIFFPLRKKGPKPITATVNATGFPMPLRGNVPQYGAYFVAFTIGTPGQYFEAQIDNGYSDLMINSVGCSGCVNRRKFNSTQSKTAREILCSQSNCPLCIGGVCHFDERIGLGGVAWAQASGPVYSDVLSFPGSNLGNTTIEFAVTTKSSPDFAISGGDGILGLSNVAPSFWSGTPLFDKIVQQQHIPNVYSVCLASWGGKLNLGYTAPSSTLWTPFTKGEYYPVITVNDITVDGVPLGFQPGAYADAAVATGATYLSLPQDVYSALVDSVRGMCTLPGVCSGPGSIFFGHCFPMTPTQIKSFPVISAIIPGWGSLHINPSDYLIDLNGKRCWGVGESGPPGAGTVFGDATIQNQNIIFDIANNRIGLAPGSTC